jgi:predicted DNA-binding transcriptional regulator YafY
MNRIDRLFGITIMLQSKKYVPAEKIADKFGISIRTVYRDVKALCEQGIPVSFEQNRGYFIVQGYFLPPVSFSSEEANALLLMETIVSAFADNSIQTHYTSALNKVKSVLRGAEKERLEQLTSRIKMHVPECFRGNFEYLATLQSAISGRQIVDMEYRKKDGITSLRQLEPIGLVFYGFAWHLIGWCHLRQDYRDFKVVRILRLMATDIPFKIEEHISLNEYIATMQMPAEAVM